MLVAKMVDNLKGAGQENHPSVFSNAFHKIFAFGTILHGPGGMRYFGVNTIKHENMTIWTDGDDKLLNTSEYPISWIHHKVRDEDMINIEKLTFASI